MSENRHRAKEPRQLSQAEFERQVATKQRRKLRALQHRNRNVWFGLGMFGLVGWAVAVPTVMLTALGVWLDTVRGGPRSWTLMLLIVGIGLGCLNAWRWVSKESREIERERHNNENHNGGNDV
jgi:ATP synthase protein I